MFLATTNQICQDVAVVPFLWVLPLSLYLLSFIICFDEPRWYSRAVFHPAFAVAIFLACLVLGGWAMKNIFVQIAAYSFTLFACCMVCHGELARSKPASRYLTSFYLMVALGGAMGGVLVALIVPHIFRGFWEYHLGLWMSAVLLFVVLARDKNSWLYCSRWGLPAIAVAAAMLPGTPSLVVTGRKELGSLFPVLPVLVAVYFLARGSLKGTTRAAPGPSPSTVAPRCWWWGPCSFSARRNQTQNSSVLARNFYGVLTVRELSSDQPDRRAYALSTAGSPTASSSSRKQSAAADRLLWRHQRRWPGLGCASDAYVVGNVDRRISHRRRWPWRRYSGRLRNSGRLHSLLRNQSRGDTHR